MVTLEINVSALGKTYQCSLDENAKICDVMEDVVDLIRQKEGITFRGDMRELIFCSLDKQIIFNRGGTLSDYNVSFGETLFLL